MGYMISGITTGLILLISFFWSLPDGNLHIVFCDVGQGDAAYIRFPDGRDMLVDGGPNNQVLECLGRHMPFWDRHINLVLLTHPQKDHMQGLIAVLDRYGTDYFVRSDIGNTTEGYGQLMDVVARRKVKQKFITTGETVAVGATTLSVIWPTADQIAKMNGQRDQRLNLASQGLTFSDPSVLGARAPDNLNDGSIVFALRYGSFDALFTGDADIRVESGWKNMQLADDTLEVLKFPHHGSRTGMSEEFLEQLFPASRPGLERGLVIISVGRNTYGHPAEATLATLAKQAIPVKRTDKEGDIEVVSDGRGWEVVSKASFVNFHE